MTNTLRTVCVFLSTRPISWPQALALAPNLYLPVQVEVLLLLPQLLALFRQLIPLPLLQILLLLLLLLLILLLTTTTYYHFLQLITITVYYCYLLLLTTNYYYLPLLLTTTYCYYLLLPTTSYYYHLLLLLTTTSYYYLLLVNIWSLLFETTKLVLQQHWLKRTNKIWAAVATMSQLIYQTQVKLTSLRPCKALKL